MKNLNNKGSILVEMIIAFVIVALLAAVAVPRFMGAQDRARIGAAMHDVNILYISLEKYQDDHDGDYPTSNYASVEDFTAVLKDYIENTRDYERISTSGNFASFAYAYDGSVAPTYYTITVTALDNGSTEITGTPKGVT